MKDNLSLKNPAAKKPTEMSMSKLWTNVLYFTGSFKEMQREVSLSTDSQFRFGFV